MSSKIMWLIDYKKEEKMDFGRTWTQEQIDKMAFFFLYPSGGECVKNLSTICQQFSGIF